MEESKIKLLVVEDDKNLGTMLVNYLKMKGFEVVFANNGEEGLKVFVNQKFDLCLLDVMMPKKDGFSLAKDIRNLKSKTPIIFLTAKSLEDDVKEGFSIGADDYITKPFSMDVLLMRIQAILRRVNEGESKKSAQSEFQIKHFSFFPEKRLIVNGEMQKKLTSKENELLRLLCINMGEIVDRNDALKMIWGDDNYFNSRSMDVYVTKLRKIFKAEESIQILNSHGKGFKLLVE